MRQYPWWESDLQTAWSRAVERASPCAATVAAWWRDENFENWMGMTGNDAQIETEERSRGGMWHRERTDEAYARLRTAFEDAQREVAQERQDERQRRQQMAEQLRIRRQAQRMKEEAAKPKPAAADTIAAERKPTPPCVEIESPAFFGR